MPKKPPKECQYVVTEFERACDGELDGAHDIETGCTHAYVDAAGALELRKAGTGAFYIFAPGEWKRCVWK